MVEGARRCGLHVRDASAHGGDCHVQSSVLLWVDHGDAGCCRRVEQGRRMAVAMGCCGGRCRSASAVVGAVVGVGWIEWRRKLGRIVDEASLAGADGCWPGVGRRAWS
ncbi:hypothetical protein ACLOJK_038464 [Asimina triloba]